MLFVLDEYSPSTELCSLGDGPCVLTGRCGIGEGATSSELSTCPLATLRTSVCVMDFHVLSKNGHLDWDRLVNEQTRLYALSSFWKPS